MATCPEPEFKRTVVTRPIFFWIIGGLVSLAVVISGAAYTAYSRGSDKQQEAIEKRIDSHEKACDYMYPTRREHDDLKADVQVMQNDIKHIKKTTDKLERQQEEIIDLLRNGQ